MDEVKHCPVCSCEYVLSAQVCADCGGPLHPGPPPEDEPDDDGDDAGLAPVGGCGDCGSGANVVAAADDKPDSLLATLPGQQADYLASALADDQIFTLLVCKGETQLRGPGLPSHGPLAVTWPVDVYVPQSRLRQAQELNAAMTRDGEVLPVLGLADNLDQLAEESVFADGTMLESVDDADPQQPTAESVGDVQPEGTATRFVMILLIAAVLVLGLLFR